MTKKSRLVHSNVRTVGTLLAQENKISFPPNMIILDSFSWHLRCAPEVERPKVDKVSTRVGEREIPN